jgi:hypothetical protein
MKHGALGIPTGIRHRVDGTYTLGSWDTER